LLIPNLQGNYELIGKLIENDIQLPVVMDNDVNLMALGELHFGTARGYRHIICISVTQGIGSGIIINQQIYRGSRGISGEIGHTIVDINGEKCGCGNRGCLETVAGGRALVKQCRDAIEDDIKDPASDRNVFKLIRGKVDARDPDCTAAIQKVGYHLGIGIANVIHNYNPEICIMTGMIVEIFPEIMETAQITAKEYLLSGAKDTIVTRSSLGENCGALGAVASVVDNLLYGSETIHERQ
jgi:predicted NBD/HSP70 family sugar kinase